MSHTIEAAHFRISDACRTTHGDGEGVVDETLRRLRAEMLASLKGWAPGRGILFHVRFSIERPDPLAERSSA